MQNKLSLLRFFPFNCGRPNTHQVVVERAAHDAIHAGEGPIDLRFNGFTPAVNEGGTVTVYAECYNHLSMSYDIEEFQVTMAEGSTELMLGSFERHGLKYNINYNIDSGEFYAHPSDWVSVMPKFLVAGTYHLVESNGSKHDVAVTTNMFNLPWIAHDLSTDREREPVHPSLTMLCLKHSDWAHAQALKKCPNIDPMLMSTAHLASSLEVVDGVNYGFGPQPAVDWVYIHALSRSVYRVMNAHNGRVTLRNDVTGRRYFCSVDKFKAEFIRTNKNWDNADPTANVVQHNPRSTCQPK